MSANLAELIESAYSAAEFIDKYVDVVDGDYGVPEANEAMVLSFRLRNAIAWAEREISRTPQQQHEDRIEELDLQWNR